MKDDPESIALREEHARAIRDAAEAKDVLDHIETIHAAHPSSVILNLLTRLLRWAVRGMNEHEEDARIVARKTYGR